MPGSGPYPPFVPHVWPMMDEDAGLPAHAYAACTHVCGPSCGQHARARWEHAAHAGRASREGHFRAQGGRGASGCDLGRALQGARRKGLFRVRVGKGASGCESGRALQGARREGHFNVRVGKGTSGCESGRALQVAWADATHWLHLGHAPAFVRRQHLGYT
eukprot:365866-Chlamydomonas_euryale.AAC.10